MTHSADYVAKRDYHLAKMEGWASGRLSYMNYGPNAPYTPDVVAVMDAQEVVKHSACAQAYAALIDGSQRAD